VAPKLDLSLFIVLERDDAALDGPGEADEDDDEEEEDEDEVVDAAEEVYDGFCRRGTALVFSSTISSCTVSFRLLLTMPLKSPPAPDLDRGGV